MKRQVLGIALAAISFGSFEEAFAEDRASGWSGAYYGVGVSYGHLTTDQYSPPQKVYAGYPAADYDGWHAYGFLQAGLRHQFGPYVLGARLRHQQTGSDRDEFLKVDEVVSANAVAITTLSGTFGYLARPKVLLYSTAGLAYGRFNYGSVDERWGQVDDSLDDNRTGIAIGFGAEYQMTDRVSIFSEYSHTRFDKGRSTFEYGPESYTKSWTYDFTHSLSEVQVGMNFRF